MARKSDKVLKTTVAGAKTAASVVRGGIKVAKNFGTLFGYALNPMSKVRAVGTLLTSIKPLIKSYQKSTAIKKKGQDALQSLSQRRAYQIESSSLGYNNKALINRINKLKAKEFGEVKKRVAISKEAGKASKNIVGGVAAYGSIGLGTYSLIKGKDTMTSSQIKKRENQKKTFEQRYNQQRGY